MGEILLGNIKGEKGDDGTSFKISGYYPTLDELMFAIPHPETGDAYGVGSSYPYDIYIYSPLNGWVNNGSIQGPKGDKGDRGEQGAPGIQGLQGEKGDKGDKGADGTNATITGVTATVDGTTGTPKVTVTMGGNSSQRSFNFAFSGLKGEKGDGSGSTVKDTIYLTDTLCIKAEEDGIWIENNGTSVRLYSKDDNKIQAGYASYANTANCANYDSDGRKLKGTTFYEFGDSYASVVLNDREALSYGVVDSFSVELPEDYSIDFASSVYFTTSSSVGDDFVQADGVYFKGDNTNGGTFTPEADTRYTIKFEYNGERFVATVSGVPSGA